MIRVLVVLVPGRAHGACAVNQPAQQEKEESLRQWASTLLSTRLDTNNLGSRRRADGHLDAAALLPATLALGGRPVGAGPVLVLGRAHGAVDHPAQEQQRVGRRGLAGQLEEARLADDDLVCFGVDVGLGEAGVGFPLEGDNEDLVGGRGVVSLTGGLV